MSRVSTYGSRTQPPATRPWHARAGLAVLRSAEFLAAGLALVALTPLIGVVALLVRHDSNGPIIERERRTGGRGGRVFDRYRFRTTVEGAGTATHQRIADVMGATCDRVTPTGRFLRATRLYRLPRLVNVVAGDDRIIS